MGEENTSNAELHRNGSDEIDESTFSEDDWSLIEVEDDFEEGVKLTQDTGGAQSGNTATHSAGAANAAKQPQAVVDFLHRFLSEMGMTETLDCFQAEWHEMVQKGLVDPKRVDVMPNVYIQNRDLETELKNATKECDEYKLAISAAGETVVKVQKARDSHLLRHKRTMQEKNKLIEDIRKLTTQCSDYQPKVKEMNGKYQTLVKQTMASVSVALERDKALRQAKQQHNNEDEGE